MCAYDMQSLQYFFSRSVSIFYRFLILCFSPYLLCCISFFIPFFLASFRFIQSYVHKEEHMHTFCVKAASKQQNTRLYKIVSLLLEFNGVRMFSCYTYSITLILHRSFFLITRVGSLFHVVRQQQVSAVS